MALTDQVRIWYPEVVLNHAQRGQPGYEPVCDITKAVRLEFPKAGGEVYRLLVHPKTKEAWQAYVVVMRKYGIVVPLAGGTHNCRNIGTSDWPSLHAYCTALDLPPNSYKPAAFQTAVLAIRTNDGAQVFKNLASIDDRMHDQINCSPTALASGIDWTTVEGGEDMLSQDDKDWILAAIASDNVPQTEQVWQRFPIRNLAGNFVPLVLAIQFIYRAIEQGIVADVDEQAVADAVLAQINLRQVQ
jgi:hypothetical protein